VKTYYHLLPFKLLFTWRGECNRGIKPGILVVAGLGKKLSILFVRVLSNLALLGYLVPCRINISIFPTASFV
jgi:hypothetical protein